MTVEAGRTMEAPAPGEVCPVALTELPPTLHRSLDPKSPVPVRMMAAKGLIPCGPRDLLTALFFLSFDPDPAVAQTAVASAAGLPEKTLGAGLRDDELLPEVLAFYGRTLRGNDRYLELIVLHGNTPDEAVEAIAQEASAAVLDVVAQNQLRILRSEGTVRALVRSPRVRASTRESVLDFCVRSGMNIADLPEFAEVRRKIFGAEPETRRELEESATAEAVLQEFGEAISEESSTMDDFKRLNLTQQLLKMTIAQKIKLAGRGNKEARTILLRDANKLVALAAAQSPRITEGEILALANSRTVHEEVLRYILKNREWMKSYKVKVNLVNNPRTPYAVSLKLLQHIRSNELKTVARNRNVASVVMVQAKMLLQKKSGG